MTDIRTQFLIQVLDKIGGPLTAAIAAGPTLETEAAGAQRMAELLNRSVQLGLSVAEQMNVRDEGQADGVHLSLTAFASPLMAGHYLLSGSVPNDADIKKLTSVMQSVLTFADNFTPAADSNLRLQSTEAGSPGDEALIYVQALNAFSPVLQVVNDYSFGKPENKLVQEIATRLLQKAGALREDIFGKDQPPKLRSQIDLVLMRLLCGLYASCHAAEVRRLMSLSEQARAGANVSIDPVWTALDMQLVMARVVAEQIVPLDRTKSTPAKQSSSGSAGPTPAAIQQLVEKVKVSPPAKSSEMKTSASGVPENKSTSVGANPMAFFAPGAKKDTGEDDAA